MPSLIYRFVFELRGKEAEELGQEIEQELKDRELGKSGLFRLMWQAYKEKKPAPESGQEHGTP